MNKTTIQTPGGIKNKISAAVDALKDNMIAFIQKLIQTPSLPGEEKKVQNIIAEKLKELNFDLDIIPIQLEVLNNHRAFSHDGFPVDNRMNVIGLWKGDNPDKPTPNNNNCGSLILNGHVDVVSPGDESQWEYSPWSGTIKNRRIYGRGSADMKAGLAAAVFACEALQKLGYQPGKDIMIQSVVGEETGGCGTLTNIIRGYTADAAIIMEPTELKIYPVQSGALSFRIKIKGKSSHACMKNKGVSAVEKFYIIFHAVKITKKGAVLMNMGKARRKHEPGVMKDFLIELGIPVVGAITGKGRVEGGDLVWLDEQTLVAGRGYRTNDEGIRLIEVDDEEYNGLGSNVLTLAPRKCLVLAGNPVTRQKMEAAGVKVLEYKGSQLSLKGTGGPTCLTCPILRAL